MAGLEQLANLYVRAAWRRVESAGRDGGPAPAATRRSRTKARKPARAPGAAVPSAEVVTAALGEIGKARELLDRLIAVDPSVERLDLCGSLHKREAMIHAAAGSSEGRTCRARARCARAIAPRASSPDPRRRPTLFYPMMNVLAAELACAGRRTAAHRGGGSLPRIRESLAGRVAASPDFWSVVGQTELKMYEAVAAGSLAAAHETLWQEFSEHHQRVSAPRMWASVYDNATLILRRYAREHTGAERKAAVTLLDALRGLTR